MESPLDLVGWWSTLPHFVQLAIACGGPFAVFCGFCLYLGYPEGIVTAFTRGSRPGAIDLWAAMRVERLPWWLQRFGAYEPDLDDDAEWVDEAEAAVDDAAAKRRYGY